MAQQDRDALKKESQILSDFHSIFSTEAGLRILEAWEVEFSDSSYEPNGPRDATIFNEGRRALFLKIKENIANGCDPEAWLERQLLLKAMEEQDA